MFFFRFGANNRVSRSVSATIKGYYDGAYPNWSKTPNHVKITWFKCFAVRFLNLIKFSLLNIYIYIYIYIFLIFIINCNFFKIFMFQQKWHWSLGITERVKAEFVAKAKIRLCNTVSDWKDKWEIYGYEGKPTELTTDVWDGLIAYWEHPSSIRKANSCSASRRTKDKDGHLPMLHRTGQKPHAGVRLEAVSFVLNIYFKIFN